MGPGGGMNRMPMGQMGGMGGGMGMMGAGRMMGPMGSGGRMMGPQGMGAIQGGPGQGQFGMSRMPGQMINRPGWFMIPYTFYRPIASWDSLFVSVSLVFISGRSPFCSLYS